MSVICYVHYINSRPSVQAWMAFVARFLHFCCRVAQKNGLQGEDLLEVEPLVYRVRVMVLRPVRAYQREA